MLRAGIFAIETCIEVYLVLALGAGQVGDNLSETTTHVQFAGRCKRCHTDVAARLGIIALQECDALVHIARHGENSQVKCGPRHRWSKRRARSF